MTEKVYVFHGNNATFCAAVFSSKELAEEWIAKQAVSGLLTAYPLNQSAYDWAIENDFFTPNKEHQSSANFIARFTSASQEHYHYELGKNKDDFSN